MITSDPRRFKKAQEVTTLWRKLLFEQAGVIQGSSEYLKIDAKMRGALKPGKYRYFKSTRAKPRVWEVYGVVLNGDVGTGQAAYLVLCAKLYGPSEGRVMTRALLGSEGFLTPVAKKSRKRNSYTGPRFVKTRTKQKKR